MSRYLFRVFVEYFTGSRYQDLCSLIFKGMSVEPPEIDTVSKMWKENK